MFLTNLLKQWYARWQADLTRPTTPIESPETPVSEAPDFEVSPPPSNPTTPVVAEPPSPPVPGPSEETAQPNPGGEDSFKFSFTEGFEQARNINDLRDTVGGGWMGAQLVRGSIALDTDNVHSGATSMRMVADNNIGKAHLFKGDVWQQSGDVLNASAHFWFPEDASLDDVYIMDWESKSAWSSLNTLPNTQPGIRIGLFGAEGRIAVERGKMGVAMERDFTSNVAMPREEWVKIEWRLKLGQGEEGRTQVLLNDRMIIDGRGTTYLDEAVANDRGLLLNEDYAFDRFKVGLTANSSAQQLQLFMDDIEVSTWSGDGQSPAWAADVLL